MKRINLFVNFCVLGLLCSCGNNVNSSASAKESSASSMDSSVSLSTSTETSSIVVYFSATGTTKTIAEKIQSLTSSDIHEIVPKVPYTSEDLNYNDSSTRATKEQNDSTARPEISGDKIDLSQYQEIYLGYPIWWGQAPKIMYTFVESYSFKDKIIKPFVTSGSSSIGSSATNLEKAADGGTWKDGKRFSSSSSDTEIQNWIDSLKD